MCERAVFGEGFALEFVPDEFKTENVCLCAMFDEPEAFEFVPERLLTPEFFEKMAERSVFITRKMAESQPSISSQKFISTETCLKALKTDNAFSLSDVPRDSLTEEMVNANLEKTGKCFDVVPDQLKTEELTEKVLTADGLALKFVPAHQRTEKLCEIAVSGNGSSLQFVPPELRSERIFAVAFESHPWTTLKLMPKESRTIKMFEIALDRPYIWHPEIIPDDLFTKRVALKLAERKSSLDDFPGKFAIEIDGKMFLNIFDDEKRALEIVSQNGLAIRLIPPHQLTDEMKICAVKSNPTILKEIEPKTRDICLSAVKKCGLALKLVPEEMRDEEMCAEACKTADGALEFVPTKFITEDLVKLAFSDRFRNPVCRLKRIGSNEVRFSSRVALSEVGHLSIEEFVSGKWDTTKFEIFQF